MKELLGLAIKHSKPFEVTALLHESLDKAAFEEKILQEFPTANYWLLECQTSAGLQWLTFKDTSALHAAVEQISLNLDEPLTLFLHAMTGRKAAGLLFSRHPERMDLAFRVLEIASFEQEDKNNQRWVFDALGKLHYQPVIEAIPPFPLEPFVALCATSDAKNLGPQLFYWWHDGDALYLLAQRSMPALAASSEAWRQADSLWPGAVSPLWYSLSARWLKLHFWQPLAKRLGATELENTEPYRRQAAHLYLNSQFALALSPYTKQMQAYLPVDWQHQPFIALRRFTPVSTLRLKFRLLGLRKSLAARTQKRALSQDEAWYQWLQLDHIGEQLASILGELHYVYGCNALDCSTELTQRFGADPLLPFIIEDKKALDSLRLQDECAQEPTLSQKPLGYLSSATTQNLYQLATELWHELGLHFRQLSEFLGELFVQHGSLAHVDAIYFLYFDELWDLIHEGKNVSQVRLLERQHKYMQAALAQAPLWQLSGVGYQGGRLHVEKGFYISGMIVVSGEANGKTRLVHSHWCLNEIEAGEVLILKHYHLSWLPWFSQASAIILVAEEDTLGQLSSLAMQQNIPMLTAVSDALGYFVNGDRVQVHAIDEGWIGHKQQEDKSKT